MSLFNGYPVAEILTIFLARAPMPPKPPNQNLGRFSFSC